MGDDKVLDFNHKFDIEAALREGPGESPAADAAAEPAAGEGEDEALAFEKLSLLPRVGDPYIGHTRPNSRSLPMLVLLGKDGSRPTFSYGDLRFMDWMPPQRPGNGPGLLLRFLGVGQAELEGRHLDRLHGYLYLHRLAWIRELPTGRVVKDDNAVVITGMTVKLLGS